MKCELRHFCSTSAYYFITFCGTKNKINDKLCLSVVLMFSGFYACVKGGGYLGGGYLKDPWIRNMEMK